ncbi:hypothetical protein SKAU_G00070450 [Synaphobranchus kaupii]|uniref:Uncharacterized protein n=1 Tax=Synaphobranchus kaupii TaxID=118154 RepID=A0A9Q1G6U4_SYNKA|nr:hypothetical protein SKAU_G00070450 [Synaphobranchus kaupii]
MIICSWLIAPWPPAQWDLWLPQHGVTARRDSGRCLCQHCARAEERGAAVTSQRRALCAARAPSLRRPRPAPNASTAPTQGQSQSSYATRARGDGGSAYAPVARFSAEVLLTLFTIHYRQGDLEPRRPEVLNSTLHHSGGGALRRESYPPRAVSRQVLQIQDKSLLYSGGALAALPPAASRAPAGAGARGKPH